MGYLIGGARRKEQEIVTSDKDYSGLSNEQLLKLRDQTVKDIAKFNNFQMVRKITLNSCYGFLGNQYFQHFKLANEPITLSGQVSIRWIENRMNGFLNKILKTEDVDYVIASDTDSIYINFGGIVESFLKKFDGDKQKTVDMIDKICQDQLEPFIDKSYQQLSEICEYMIRR